MPAVRAEMRSSKLKVGSRQYPTYVLQDTSETISIRQAGKTQPDGALGTSHYHTPLTCKKPAVLHLCLRIGPSNDAERRELISTALRQYQSCNGFEASAAPHAVAKLTRLFMQLMSERPETVIRYRVSEIDAATYQNDAVQSQQINGSEYDTSAP